MESGVIMNFREKLIEINKKTKYYKEPNKIINRIFLHKTIEKEYIILFSKSNYNASRISDFLGIRTTEVEELFELMMN